VRLLALAALAATTVVLGACGGGADTGDVEAITATITESATTSFPADCRRLHTRRSLEQDTKLQGEAAVRACEEDALYENTQVADGVTVTEIDVDGSRATATVALDGSPLDGQVLTMDLVWSEHWKLDRIAGFVEFDREKLILGLGRSIFSGAATRGDADIASCLVTQLEALDDTALETLVLDSSPDEIIELFGLCESHSESV
jgi:hypothetical protein